MDLGTAMRPGQSGVSYDQQLSLAIAYWQALAAAGNLDQNAAFGTVGDAGFGNDTVAAANAAVTLLQAEQNRVHNPAT
jgi:hypothetical protein